MRQIFGLLRVFYIMTFLHYIIIYSLLIPRKKIETSTRLILLQKQ